MIRIIAAAALASALAAAPAAAQTASPAAKAVLGHWDVEVVEGESKGDTAEMVISSEDGALVAEMVYTDSRAAESARQNCAVSLSAAASDAETRVEIRCSVSAPFWFPDHFDLALKSPSRMEGAHLSALSGYAIFRRRPNDLTS